jgi:hypothetical protein
VNVISFAFWRFYDYHLAESSGFHVPFYWTWPTSWGTESHWLFTGISCSAAAGLARRPWCSRLRHWRWIAGMCVRGRSRFWVWCWETDSYGYV